MKFIVAGTADDGRSAVLRNETLSTDAMQTLWKLSEVPPVVQRPGTVASYDMGLKPGEACWMIVRHAPNSTAAMHRTDAISFSTVLSGAIDLVLDTETVRLEAGDNLALLGVIHGWETGAEGATMSATAIGLAPA